MGFTGEVGIRGGENWQEGKVVVGGILDTNSVSFDNINTNQIYNAHKVNCPIRRTKLHDDDDDDDDDDDEDDDQRQTYDILEIMGGWWWGGLWRLWWRLWQWGRWWWWWWETHIWYCCNSEWIMMKMIDKQTYCCNNRWLTDPTLSKLKLVITSR